MFSHVMLGANDLAAARQFYDATFAALGGPAGRYDAKGRILYMHDGGLFMLSKPIDGEPACPANGGTLGFKAGSPEKVEAWHSAGVANGGVSIEDAAGPRESGIGTIFLAYLRDPTGNKICAMHMMNS
ncbi:VOC family protein [Sphingobium phenoxybenzoativorans]|uniref:VOC family protein n=1 Tax=Sphingobium phenoxybenzoativorans TaxID=1592790 RepID=UPI00087326F1|nr:VOC family protein [Sphingobium phenoxybenzoativorans]